MKRLFDFYTTSLKFYVMVDFQYQFGTLITTIWMVIEPVIYLVVWTTVAIENGGSLSGYTPGGLAAYYITWTFVRFMNLTCTPYAWEWRIRHGYLANELLRPIHPIHNDISEHVGGKVHFFLVWLPLAAALVWFFKPDLHPTWVQVFIFFVSCWEAFLVRTLFFSGIGMVAFWTTKVGAIFDLVFALELILSGRLVPLSLMPGWIQQIAVYLPFQWTFYFPIRVLTGSPDTSELLAGLGIQLIWILGEAGLVSLIWRFAVRRFTSVGN